MAKVLGEPARFASQEATRQHVRVLLTCMTAIFLGSVVIGVCLAGFVPIDTLHPWFRSAILTIAFLGLLGIRRWVITRVRKIEKHRQGWRRGASGEVQVGNILSDLPDEFYVVNDIATEYGNLDHVVIGPTGVFVIETKNCRGVVTADGEGELLRNGRKTEREHVRPLIKRMMDMREKVLMLAHGIDPFYNAVIVFTAAWVDAKWGSTGATNCIRDDQLYDYITERKTGARLNADEIKRLSQAFLGLAHIDQGFSRATVSM